MLEIVLVNYVSFSKKKIIQSEVNVFCTRYVVNRSFHSCTAWEIFIHIYCAIRFLFFPPTHINWILTWSKAKCRYTGTKLDIVIGSFLVPESQQCKLLVTLVTRNTQECHILFWEAELTTATKKILTLVGNLGNTSGGLHCPFFFMHLWPLKLYSCFHFQIPIYIHTIVHSTEVGREPRPHFIDRERDS